MKRNGSRLQQRPGTLHKFRELATRHGIRRWRSELENHTKKPALSQRMIMSGCPHFKKSAASLLLPHADAVETGIAARHRFSNVFGKVDAAGFPAHTRLQQPGSASIIFRRDKLLRA